jgi:hypothetical protein
MEFFLKAFIRLWPPLARPEPTQYDRAAGQIAIAKAGALNLA